MTNTKSTLHPSTNLTRDSEGDLYVEYPELYLGEHLWMPEEHPVTPGGLPHHWQDLLPSWWSRWHSQPTPLREILEIVLDYHLFPAQVQGDSERSILIRMGNFMKRHAGKPLYGFRFYPLKLKKGKNSGVRYVLLDERNGLQKREV